MKLLNIFIIASLIANIITNNVYGCCCIRRKKEPIATPSTRPNTDSELNGQDTLKTSGGQIVRLQPTYHGDSISSAEIIYRMTARRQKFILTLIPQSVIGTTPVYREFYGVAPSTS